MGASDFLPIRPINNEERKQVHHADPQGHRFLLLRFECPHVHVAERDGSLVIAPVGHAPALVAAGNGERAGHLCQPEIIGSRVA